MRPATWIFLGAVTLACLYLGTLGTRFDFIDDGNLVYPTPAASLSQRLHLTWHKIVANYEDLGPFRPVLWAQWEIQAELFEAQAVRWRAARLLWLMLAIGMFLWLLHELGIPRTAAWVTAALAFWNPFRNEVWLSLTLSEGVALPYALFALVCALRAGRSQRPWPWDLCGALCVLAALGCKNTFAALVPAQVLLRIAPDGQSLRDGLRQHGWRAALLTLTLLFPLAHYIYFKLHWHPGQYVTHPITWNSAKLYFWALLGASNIDVMGLGVGLMLFALWRQRQSRSAAESGPLLTTQDLPLVRAAIALLVVGTLLYLPLAAISGRYTLPAVWGLDLLFALALTRFLALPVHAWRRLASAGLAAGIVLVGIQSCGKQSSFAARADMLWHMLERAEASLPPGSCIGWQASKNLDPSEGIHFGWHLEARRHNPLTVVFFDELGNPSAPNGNTDVPPALFINGVGMPLVCVRGQEFESRYWHGLRSHHGYMYGKPPPDAPRQTP